MALLGFPFILFHSQVVPVSSNGVEFSQRAQFLLTALRFSDSTLQTVKHIPSMSKVLLLTGSLLSKGLGVPVVVFRIGHTS